MHVTDVYLDPDPQLGIGVQMRNESFALVSRTQVRDEKE